MFVAFLWLLSLDDCGSVHTYFRFGSNSTHLLCQKGNIEDGACALSLLCDVCCLCVCVCVACSMRALAYVVCM